MCYYVSWLRNNQCYIVANGGLPSMALCKLKQLIPCTFVVIQYIDIMMQNIGVTWWPQTDSEYILPHLCITVYAHRNVYVYAPSCVWYRFRYRNVDIYIYIYIYIEKDVDVYINIFLWIHIYIYIWTSIIGRESGADDSRWEGWCQGWGWWGRWSDGDDGNGWRR